MFCFCLLNINYVSAMELPVEFSVKAKKANVIVEGKVISQESFWNESGTKILTANEILIYKNFKSNLKSSISEDRILVITEGGIIGDEMLVVTPSLELKVGDVGMFFLRDARPENKNEQSQISETLQFKPSAGTQSVIPYDLDKNIAYDNSRVFDNIKKDLYKELKPYTGKKYIEFNQLPIKENNYETDNAKVFNPNIYCFSPDVISAGTESVLTIEGIGFDSFGSNSKVELIYEHSTSGWIHQPIDNEYIVEWTGTRIQVIVPPKFGSGTIKVTNNGNGTDESTDELNVIFSRSQRIGSTVHDGPIMLVNLNVNGDDGYPIKYSTNSSNNGISFFSDIPAKQAFARALTTVREKFGLNIYYDGTTTLSIDDNDDISVIMFDNDVSELDDDVLATTYSHFSKCNTSVNPDGEWELDDVDMRFRRSPSTSTYDWNFSTASPSFSQFDFESVSLHELGHFGQLGHVNEADAVMSTSIANGQVKRDALACYEVKGMKFINEQSMAYDACTNGGVVETYVLHPDFQGYLSDAGCQMPSICNTPCANRIFDNSHITHTQSNIHYEASTFIDSRSTIESGANIIYDAGDFIELKDVFLAEAGSVFCGVIDGCGGALKTEGGAGEVAEATPNKTALEALPEIVSNYPNPFKNSTMISFNLDKASSVSLNVYDMSGKKVAGLLENEDRTAGSYQVPFDGSNLISGIYFYTLQTNTNTVTGKMLLHK